MPPDSALFVTCMDCKVVWDMDMDPAGCVEDDHRHVLNRYGDGKESD